MPLLSRPISFVVPLSRLLRCQGQSLPPWLWYVLTEICHRQEQRCRGPFPRYKAWCRGSERPHLNYQLKVNEGQVQCDIDRSIYSRKLLTKPTYYTYTYTRNALTYAPSTVELCIKSNTWCYLSHISCIIDQYLSRYETTDIHTILYAKNSK